MPHLTEDALEKAVTIREPKDLGYEGQPPKSDHLVSSEVEDEVDDVEPPAPPGLPFSKGKCIALVLTLAGASFLNVSHEFILKA
jgi:hypothetical protein